MEYFSDFSNPDLIFPFSSNVNMLFHKFSVSSVFTQNKSRSEFLYGKVQVSFHY